VIPIDAIANEILIKVVVNIFLLIVGLFYRKMRVLLENLSPFARPIAFCIIAFLFLVSNIIMQLYSQYYNVLFFIASFAIFIWLSIAEISAFWRLGLLGVDKSISKGVDYKKALLLCNDSLEFIGIGASKLINERDVFRAAIKRCHREGRPIRFLLCPPDSSYLLNAARRYTRPASEYQETVKQSLNELRFLKEELSQNIEVRFYESLPLFRLMFINDSICLASHYILGEGQGSNMPQLHVWKKPPGRRDNESLYYPLRKYYEEIWREGEPWDFKKYLI
jgi:hypothetical protein